MRNKTHLKSLGRGPELFLIFINTKGSVGDISEEYKELLRFIDSSQDRYYNNKLANDLLSDLKKARSNEEWRHDYMTWVDYGNECRAEESVLHGQLRKKQWNIFAIHFILWYKIV